MTIYVLLREKKIELETIWSTYRVTTNYDEIQKDLQSLRNISTVFPCKVEIWENSTCIDTIYYLL